MKLRFRVRAPAGPGVDPATERVVDVDVPPMGLHLGRGAACDLLLPYSAVSSLHARFIPWGTGWAIEDQRSANGTFVGGRRLQAQAPEPIAIGTSLRLADVGLWFEGESRTLGQGQVAESTATLARRLVADLLGASASPEPTQLVILSGQPTGLTVDLVAPGRIVTLGRSATCDVVVDDDDVSREHAAFERRWEGIFVRDLGSKNGTYVGAQRITGETRLADGDVVQVGDTLLRVDDPQDRYLRKLNDEEVLSVSRSPSNREAAWLGESRRAPPGEAPAQGPCEIPTDASGPAMPAPPSKAEALDPVVKEDVAEGSGRGGLSWPSLLAGAVLAAVAAVFAWLVLG